MGCKVTLRKGKMYDFAYKLFNVALPRVRDFRGVSLIHLMVEEIIQWELKNNLFSQKSNMTKLIKLEEWI